MRAFGPRTGSRATGKDVRLASLRRTVKPSAKPRDTSSTNVRLTIGARCTRRKTVVDMTIAELEQRQGSRRLSRWHGLNIEKLGVHDSGCVGQTLRFAERGAVQETLIASVQRTVLH